MKRSDLNYQIVDCKDFSADFLLGLDNVLVCRVCINKERIMLC